MYTSPEFYPFPRFNVSLETEKGTCNLGDRNQPDFCHAFSAGNTGWPETIVAECCNRSWSA
jgi:hypothetical protein